MTKKARFFRHISLAVFAVVSLVILGLPSTQALVIVPATNDRCGPRTDPGCVSTGALDVPQATVPGRPVRQCYEFDTSNMTSGPIGIDVVNDATPGLTWLNDLWFRLPGPHCPGKTILISASGSTYAAASYLVTQGGGPPTFICDTTCDGIAGNSFFDSDVVVSSTTGNYAITVPASLAGRDFYTMVNGNGSGVLRYCVTTSCGR